MLVLRLMSRADFTSIAVDMGAGSIRVMMGIIGTEGISYQEVHRFTNEIVVRGGRDRWDMDRITREIRLGISRALHAPGPAPASIGVDSWGVDFVMLGDHGELMEAPVAYRDKRTEGMPELWTSMISDMETFRRTGINFYLFNTLFQLLSLKDSELFKNTSKILFIPCYLNFLLSGSAWNELTISSTSQLLELHGMDWDAEILGTLGLSRKILGDVILPGTCLGPVTIPEAAGAGMECIGVCGHDTAGVVAAIPAADQDYAYISTGTWCIIGVESDTPLVSEEALLLGITNERGYDNTYRILKNITGLWLIQGLISSFPRGTTFAELEEISRQGGEIMQVIDPDDPEFYHPGEMKEAFDLYFRKTGQPAPSHPSGYIKCAYDSLCFSFRYHIEKLELLTGKSVKVLHVVGGGSQSEMLNQRIATICGKRVITGPVEGATLGNVLVQALAMGRIGSLAEGRELIRQSFPLGTYHPAGISDRTRDRFRKFLNLKEIKTVD
jgi:rhamnulokinase